MISKIRPILLSAAACACLCANGLTVHAATIMKLNLGGSGPDLSMAGGVLGTSSDLDATTAGDQNTAIEYTGFLDPISDVNTSVASFSLSGVTAVGAPNVTSVVSQNFNGGALSLYDPSNILLLSGTLGDSTLVGTLGPPGTGAFFSTTFGSVTGGALAPFIVDNSLSLSINLTNVNGGAGLSLAPGGQALGAFTADSFVNVGGEPTDSAGGLPEPGTLVLAATALFAGAAARRRAA
jgi:hypothetical protein